MSECIGLLGFTFFTQGSLTKTYQCNGFNSSDSSNYGSDAPTCDNVSDSSNSGSDAPTCDNVSDSSILNFITASKTNILHVTNLIDYVKEESGYSNVQDDISYMYHHPYIISNRKNITKWYTILTSNASNGWLYENGYWKSLSLCGYSLVTSELECMKTLRHFLFAFFSKEELYRISVPNALLSIILLRNEAPLFVSFSSIMNDFSVSLTPHLCLIKKYFSTKMILFSIIFHLNPIIKIDLTETLLSEIIHIICHSNDRHRGERLIFEHIFLWKDYP
jgi:hypothetical protein